MINDFDYEGIKLPVSERGYCRIEKKKNNYINLFCYEIDLTYPVYVPDLKFENCMDLLLITDENKSHYVYIKDFNGFVCNKSKSKNKNFRKCWLQ